jgi:hypothetical protein
VDGSDEFLIEVDGMSNERDKSEVALNFWHRMMGGKK